MWDRGEEYSRVGILWDICMPLAMGILLVGPLWLHGVGRPTWVLDLCAYIVVLVWYVEGSGWGGRER